MRIFLFLFVLIVSSFAVYTSAQEGSSTTGGSDIASTPLVAIVTTEQNPPADTSATTKANNPTENPSGDSTPSTANPNPGTAEPSNSKSTSSQEEITTVSVTQTTTTVPTTVPVWAEFFVDCDSEPGYCSYKISAPEIDINQYNAQQANLTADQSEYNSASQESYTVNSTFEASDAYKNYTELVDLYNQIVENYNTLVSTVDIALNQSNEVGNIINQAWGSLNGSDGGVFSDSSSCYYQRCSRYTTTTTTTTTTRPTTVSACTNYNCTTYDDYNSDSCRVINNQPICQCQGNLDPKNHCGEPQCYRSTAGLLTGLPGPLWSVGYHRNETSPNIADVSYGSNRNCIYVINAGDSSKKLYVYLHDRNKPSYNLDPTSTLLLNENEIPKDPKKVQLALDHYLNKYPSSSIKVQFKSGNVKGKGFYFDFDIRDTPLTS